jgi:diaminopimelate decarboxylase
MTARRTACPTLPETFLADIAAWTSRGRDAAVPLHGATASDLFKRARRAAHRLSTNEVQVVSGYSIKTNPDERLIKLALDNGFYAEAISLLEVQKALESASAPTR